MGSIVEGFTTAFRKFVTDGIPASGAHHPDKDEVQHIGTLIEAALGAIGMGALVAVVYATKAELDADLAHDADTVALVYADPDDANSDLYVKVGASGAGSWTNTGALHAIVEGLAQPFVDEAAASAVLAEEAADRIVAILTTTPATILSVADADGYEALSIRGPTEIDEDGEIETGSFRTQQSAYWLHAVADSAGEVLFGVDEDGYFRANIPTTASEAASRANLKYDINFFPIYGQSLSVGQADPALSTIASAKNLMFYRGMRPQYDYDAEAPAVWYQSLVPAAEQDPPPGSLGEPFPLGETPAMGAGEAILEALESIHGLDPADLSFQMLLSTPGFGASSIVQLEQGTTPYLRLLEQVTEGRDLAWADDKTFAVPAVGWVQGESDYMIGTTRAAYLALLETLAADLNTDIKAITGQSEDVHLICYQLASHKVGGSATPTIALALLEAEETNPLIHIATPMYHFDYQGASDFHLTNVSSRELGAALGRAYERIIIAEEEWKPLRPLPAFAQGTVASIPFNVPGGQLEFDTTLVTAAPNYGFEMVDSLNAPLTISSVAISPPNRVKIVAAATIPAGAKVRYAWTGAGDVGPSNGPRGNLRDSDGNWCVIFEMGV